MVPSSSCCSCLGSVVSYFLGSNVVVPINDSQLHNLSSPSSDLAQHILHSDASNSNSNDDRENTKSLRPDHLFNSLNNSPNNSPNDSPFSSPREIFYSN